MSEARKAIKVLCFPWPHGPGEVREMAVDLKAIRAQVQGDFEGHTLANGCMVYCNEEGRYTFGQEPDAIPYLFPYVAFDLPGPDSPDGVRVFSFESFEAMRAHPRKLGLIDVWGPCMVVGPADEDGYEMSVPESAAAELLAIRVEARK